MQFRFRINAAAMTLFKMTAINDKFLQISRSTVSTFVIWDLLAQLVERLYRLGGIALLAWLWFESPHRK